MNNDERVEEDALIILELWLNLTLSLPLSSNFSCSLTRNITSHSTENLAYHSLLGQKIIILSILTTPLILSLWEVGRMHFLNWEVKGLNPVTVPLVCVLMRQLVIKLRAKQSVVATLHFTSLHFTSLHLTKCQQKMTAAYLVSSTAAS